MQLFLNSFNFQASNKSSEPMHCGLMYVERLCFTIWWHNFSPFCVVVWWVVQNQNPEASFLSQNILEQWRWCLWCNFHWVMFIQVSNGNGLEATKNHYPSNSDTLSWNLLSSNTFLPISVSFLIDLFLFSDGNNYAFL